MMQKNKKKKPRTLPPATVWPPKSVVFDAFEQTVKELNDHVHGGKAAWDTADLVASPRNKRLSGTTDAATRERWLHRAAIVSAVSAHEFFLKSLVAATLLSRKLPERGLAELRVYWSRVDEGSSIKELWAESVARSVASATYAEQPNEVRDALSIDHDEMAQKSGPPFDADLVKIACLVRNCIVHDDGRADSRLVEAGKSKNVSCSLGKPIPMDGPLLWKLVGALLDHARAFDVMVSWHNELLHRRAQKKKIMA